MEHASENVRKGLEGGGNMSGQPVVFKQLLDAQAA